MAIAPVTRGEHAKDGLQASKEARRAVAGGGDAGRRAARPPRGARAAESGGPGRRGAPATYMSINQAARSWALVPHQARLVTPTSPICDLETTWATHAVTASPRETWATHAVTASPREIWATHAVTASSRETWATHAVTASPKETWAT